MISLFSIIILCKHRSLLLCDLKFKNYNCILLDVTNNTILRSRDALLVTCDLLRSRNFILFRNCNNFILLRNCNYNFILLGNCNED